MLAARGWDRNTIRVGDAIRVTGALGRDGIRRIQMRQVVRADRSPFPEGIEEAYLPMGYSIGHWEGAMLMVETRGMKPTVWDAAGMPVSASAVLIERKYLDDSGRLHTDYEQNDPANYERPVYRHAYRERSPETGLGKYACDPHAFYRSLDLEGKLEEYWRSRSRF